jgi:cysteinyl-tRNA synthetase
VALRIYNTLSRTKEIFTPQNEKTVKMYTCGQTVYNDIHVGNARFYVVFDTVRRYLAYCGYDVRFVQNYTDIDDKLIARAAEEGRNADDLAQYYIARTLEDLENLNVQPATVTPRATHEIPAIIAMIEKLLQRGAAYEREGSVYFDTLRANRYGKLSRKNPDELLAGARIEVDSMKTNPADFILWKPAKTGEPAWESPWGPGRPGWHIECSAMIHKYLGDSIDIHGGAADLIFPHHENEIAQSEAACDCENLANYWMHCGLLTVEHKKMSKSRGNFQTLREVAARFGYDEIRFYLLSGHYRMPMEFGDEMIAAAARGLERIRNCAAALKHTQAAETNDTDILNKTASHMQNFHTAMEDDFNTADAVSIIFEWVKTVNISLANDRHTQKTLDTLHTQLTDLCGLLGILIEGTQTANVELPDAAYIEERIAARQTARKARDFAAADNIRNELAGMGIILEDTPEGVRWKYS